MVNMVSTLLSEEERKSLYDPPILNDAERTEYFTFNQDEIKIIKSFSLSEDSVLFAIKLVFFKIYFN